MIYFVHSCCFFFKQKTAYEMRISDWSSDVCSSDLRPVDERHRQDIAAQHEEQQDPDAPLASHAEGVGVRGNDHEHRQPAQTVDRKVTIAVAGPLPVRVAERA